MHVASLDADLVCSHLPCSGIRRDALAEVLAAAAPSLTQNQVTARDLALLLQAWPAAYPGHVPNTAQRTGSDNGDGRRSDGGTAFIAAAEAAGTSLAAALESSRAGVHRAKTGPVSMAAGKPAAVAGPGVGCWNGSTVTMSDLTTLIAALRQAGLGAVASRLAAAMLTGARP